MLRYSIQFQDCRNMYDCLIYFCFISVSWMILIGLVPKSINQPNKTFWGPESKPLVLWKSTFPSRTWISSKLFPRTNQLQLYITWLVLIAHRARWQNLYGTVNFRFKHIRFEEVFRFKEECRCSQNFSA